MDNSENKSENKNLHSNLNSLEGRYSFLVEFKLTLRNRITYEWIKDNINSILRVVV